MGMSVADFSAMTPEEFDAAMRAWNDREDRRSRDAWEQTRKLAVFVIQPYLKSRLTEHELLPLPWDGDADGTARPTTAPPPYDPQRVEELKKSLGLE